MKENDIFLLGRGFYYWCVESLWITGPNRATFYLKSEPVL